MKTIRRSVGMVLAIALYGCGGGGGDGSSVCSTLKVSGGESCDQGVPSVVYIQTLEGDKISSCTGTAISQTAILTAAHCVTGRPSRIDIVNSDFFRPASAYYIHPGYRGTRNGLDLAVIKVAEPMPVKPAPLQVSSGAPAPGAELVAYGYGADETGKGAIERIQAGETPLKATSLSFASATNGLFYKVVSDGAGSTCKGDSGGPILAKNNQGDWGIIAVTSFSPEVSDERPCVPVDPEAIAVVSPTQYDLAMAFILAHAPDAAMN